MCAKPGICLPIAARAAGPAKAHRVVAMGCGKEVQGRPESEYESYVYDLKKDVKHLEESIRRQEQLKRELEDEVRLAATRC